MSGDATYVFGYVVNFAVNEILIKKTSILAQKLAGVEKEIRVCSKTNETIRKHKNMNSRKSRIIEQRDIIFDILTSLRHDVCFFCL